MQPADYLRNCWIHNCTRRWNKNTKSALDSKIKPSFVITISFLLVFISLTILVPQTNAGSLTSGGSSSNFNFKSLQARPTSSSVNYNQNTNNAGGGGGGYFLVQKIAPPRHPNTLLDYNSMNSFIPNNNLQVYPEDTSSSADSSSEDDNPNYPTGPFEDTLTVPTNNPTQTLGLNLRTLQLLQPYHNLQVDCRQSQSQGCNLYEITELIATPSGPKFKRSIDPNDANAPTIRVFKYITDNDNLIAPQTITNSLEENALGNFEKAVKKKFKPNSKLGKKDKNSKKPSKEKNKLSDYNNKKVDLRSPQSVTDRSLIRNSYFSSHSHTQNDNNDINLFTSDNHNYYKYNHHRTHHTPSIPVDPSATTDLIGGDDDATSSRNTNTTTDFINAIIVAKIPSITKITTTTTTTDPRTTTTVASTLNSSSTTIIASATPPSTTFEKAPSEGDALPQVQNAYPNAATEHKVIKKQGNVVNSNIVVKGRMPTAAEFLELFNASLSERSRRSPFRYPQLYPILYQQNLMQQQQKQFQQFQNQQNQQQLQRFPQLQQANNRAALYLRNGNNNGPMPGNNNNNNGGKNNNGNNNVIGLKPPPLPPGHQQFQNKNPNQNHHHHQHQQQQQSIRMTAVPMNMNGPKQAQSFGHSPPGSSSGSPQLKSQLAPPNGIPDTLQSGSNDHFTYRPPHHLHFPNHVAVALPPPNVNFKHNSNFDHNLVPEHTWNHPMYRRYSKAAKRVQNYFGSTGTSGSGGSETAISKSNKRNRKDYRPDRPSGGKPIPLPRPRPRDREKGRRIRSRNKGRPPGPGGPDGPGIRYSYPKSAQSIQDILDHFQHDNNEIFDGIAKHTKSSSDQYNNRGGSSGPSISDDLSNELKDVRFSLMRDIREFSKRPSTIPQEDSRPIRLRSPSKSHGMSKPIEAEDIPSHILHSHRNEDPIPLPKPTLPYYRDREGDEDKHSRYDQLSKKHMRPGDDPHSPGYNHEEAFDDIFNEKSKPVREMIKSSSKFRQDSDRVDRESSRERDRDRDRDFQHSKKRDRPFRESFRDRDEDTEPSGGSGGGSKGFMDAPQPKFYSESTMKTRNKYGNDGGSDSGGVVDEDSTERYKEDRYSSSSSNKNDRPSRHPQGGTSMESRHRDRDLRGHQRDRDTRHRHNNNNNRDRHSPSTSKEDRIERDREHAYKEERPKRIRSKYRDENFNPSTSSFERSPYYSSRDRDVRERDRELPKSIRDKIRDASIEYKGTRDRETLASYRATNKPLILKRPYEPYRIPPQVFAQPDLDIFGPSLSKKSPMNIDPEFWPNLASVPEKNPYGYKKPSGVMRTPPLVLGTPSGGIPYNPHYLSHSPPPMPSPPSISSGGALSSPEDEDVLEIHTGGVGSIPIVPTYPGQDAMQEKSLQKAYLELLQHKMQAESALLNPKMHHGHPHSHTPHHHHPKPKKSPMRMKIHIYPNNEGGSSTSGAELVSMNPNLQNFANFNYQGAGYSSGSHPSSMISNPPQQQQKHGGHNLRSPPHHQQMMMGHHNGNNNNNNNNHNIVPPGPAPPPPTGYGGNNGGGGMSNGGGGSGGGSNGNNKPSSSSSSISEKNKNLVLHLHVHRRNDVGPVELVEAEASELHISTVKPLTYKDIFEDQQQQQQLENLQEHQNQEEREDQEHQTGGGEPVPDKSVSMEVPIHDDKIEDVLHTLLQFRDRGSSRKKRNHLTHPPHTNITISTSTGNKNNHNSNPTPPTMQTPSTRSGNIKNKKFKNKIKKVKKTTSNKDT